MKLLKSAIFSIYNKTNQTQTSKHIVLIVILTDEIDWLSRN